MLSLLGSALPTGAPASLGGVNFEAVFMYGLVVFVIGLIAWSKYREPPLSDPYPQERYGHGLPENPAHIELGPVVAVPVAERPAPAREQP